MSDDDEKNYWLWWQHRLEGRAVPMSEGTPFAGFYRWPRKAQYGARKTFLPVAYWPGENGVLHCRVGDQDITEERGRDIWVNVGNNPVSEEAYRDVAEKGLPWPDEHELVPMGDNLPPEEDTLEAMQGAIEPLAQEAKARIKGPPITEQGEADQIANLADRLAELWKKSDELRKAERRPHDEALREIQQKWAPLLVLAETYRNLKYMLLTPWLKAREEDAKREAEAAAATGEPPAAADIARRPRVGTRGRAMSLKTLKYAEITDYEACLAFFKDSQAMKDIVQDLANKAIRAGITVPGAKVKEESKAV